MIDSSKNLMEIPSRITYQVKARDKFLISNISRTVQAVSEERGGRKRWELKNMFNIYEFDAIKR